MSSDSDEAYRIAAEHIVYAAENHMSPREVLESIGVTHEDIPWCPDWEFVLYWLVVTYRRQIKPELDRQNYQSRRKAEQKRRHFPPAQDFRNEMRTLFVGRTENEKPEVAQKPLVTRGAA